ncbi:hypothetical protein ACFWEH_13405 [Streptomyces anulatus]|uniref:hypothetical protein n=1 Tax=Streptomyces anulatus TaxID=1892 RepID=UPI00365A70C2
MNTFLNYLVVAALFALVLAPVALGLARERRIDRQLREAERGRRAAGPPETRSGAAPGGGGGGPPPPPRGGGGGCPPGPPGVA